VKKRVKIDGETHDALVEIAKDNDIEDVDALTTSVLERAIATGGLVSSVIDDDFDEEDDDTEDA